MSGVLDLLACPACLGSLLIELSRITCAGCGRIYPVREGIPILLVDRAVLPA